jgi:uncharacterized protein (TIGR03437 family)
MGLSLWHKGTLRTGVIVLTIAFGELASFGQTSPDWRKVGGSAVELTLAAPATGAVDQVWFSPEGSVLFARTHSGRIFQTADFETWSPVEAADAPAPVSSSAARLPETGARVVAAGARGRIYGLGRQLFRSDDGGRTWENLTAYKTTPIVGTGQHSVAVSPADSEQVIVANDFGVWRSLDGGRTWTGLNQLLPNLGVRRILSTPAGPAGTRVAVEGLGAVELPPGGVVWQTAPGVPPDPDSVLKQRFAPAIRNLTAIAQAGRFVYAGTLDGRILISIDEGVTFNQTQMPARAVGPVVRLLADPSGTALAVIGGRGARVLRTITGNFWDELDGNLPDGFVYGIAAERAAGAVYLATEHGVFFGRADLMNASTPAVSWTSLTGKLPAVAATDVRLDPAGVQLYIALDGYGVYAASAPHRARNLRIVNAGDFTSRAAAPGSLLSVVGGRVDGATGGGLNYPVLAGNSSESQIQVPFEASGPTVALALRTADGIVTRDLPVQRVSPTIMVSRDGAAMLYDADSGLPLDLRTAARSNGRLHIWATGLGRVSPDWPTGVAAPLENAPKVVAQVRAFLDGAPLQVTKSSLMPGYVGFYLIEVQLPSIVNAGSSELFVSADGQESNRVQVWIEP